MLHSPGPTRKTPRLAQPLVRIQACPTDGLVPQVPQPELVACEGQGLLQTHPVVPQPLVLRGERSRVEVPAKHLQGFFVGCGGGHILHAHSLWVVPMHNCSSPEQTKPRPFPKPLVRSLTTQSWWVRGPRYLVCQDTKRQPPSPSGIPSPKCLEQVFSEVHI